MEWAHFLFLQLASMVSLFRCVDAQAGTTVNPSFGYTLRENLKATMGVMLGAFFSAFIFMGIFSFYIRHCSHRYGPRRSPLVVATDMDKCHGSCANPQVIIDKCPVLVYSAVKDLKIGRGTLECAVCLTEFQDCDKIRLLPRCHHLFHQDCVDEWLLPHMSCPLCRAALTPETETGGQRGERDVTVTLPPRESRMLERLTRSHSTGHSLVEMPEESLVVVDRYTLRLPDHVRNQILASRSRVRRFATSDVVLPGAWSSKRVCYRGGGGGGEGCNGAPFVSGGWGLGSSSTANI